MASKKQIAQLMFELFRGRETAFALKFMMKDGSKMFYTHRQGENDIPFTAEVCEDHLDGRISVGCYPMNPKSEVNWAAVDFDGKKGDPIADASALQHTLLAKLGLISWLERSQGGAGVHLWIFFDGYISGKQVRRVIGEFIPEFFVTNPKDKKTSYDRMFPNQDEISGTDYGNLCAIPLNGEKNIRTGRTAFIDGVTGKPLLDQSSVIEQIYNSRNAVEIILNKAKDLKPLPAVASKKEETIVQERIEEGGRNRALLSIAGAMRRKGASEESILAALLLENKARCVPPMEEHEVKSIARSVGKYAPSEIVGGIKNTVAIDLPTFTQIPGGMKLVSPHGCAWLKKIDKNADLVSAEELDQAFRQLNNIEHGEVLGHKIASTLTDYDQKVIDERFKDAKALPVLSCKEIWAKFGDCGKRCGHLKVAQPWEMARVPLGKLEGENKGKVYVGQDLADTAIAIATEINSGKRMGFAWGYEGLDDATEIRPKNLVVVAARRSIGKTAVMIDASYKIASRGIPQYIFSYEMSFEELALRYLARIGEVDQTVIMTGKMGKEEWQKVEEARATIIKTPLFIDDSTRDLDRVLDNAGELIYKHGKGIIWVDYLQLVKLKPGEKKKDGVDRAVDAYKHMAKILEVPVITLAQLNRKEEEAEQGEDDLDSWLKDSGDIEQTADVIHYLRGKREPGIAVRKWKLHKERHRAAGLSFRFEFNQSIFKFNPTNGRIEDDELLFTESSDDDSTLV